MRDLPVTGTGAGDTWVVDDKATKSDPRRAPKKAEDPSMRSPADISDFCASSVQPPALRVDAAIARLQRDLWGEGAYSPARWKTKAIVIG